MSHLLVQIQRYQQDVLFHHSKNIPQTNYQLRMKQGMDQAILTLVQLRYCYYLAMNRCYHILYYS